MPSLADHHSSAYTKLLLLGDSKAGKTTSLISLVKAGYHLRILDFDNLLDPLANRVRRECPDLAHNVEFRSIRDAYKGTAAGTTISGRPKAWIDSLQLLNHWKYDNVDLGVPAEWGAQSILVIDSLSRWCDSAFDFHETMMNASAKKGEADGRAVYGSAQDDVERQLANLTSPSFCTNVIVICHGQLQENPDGTKKIFPQGVGQKLSPKIPQYFPNYIRLTKRGETRTLQLKSDMMIDLANNLPPELTTKDYSPDTGLAEIFAALKGSAPAATTQDTPAKPKSVTLIRR